MRYETLLCSAERARRDRLVFAKDQRGFLVSRALMRTVLSRYAAVDPRAWRFATNAHGRPEISAPSAAAPLYFILSHTDGLVACIVFGGRDVGVDVEDTRRSGQTIEIAEQYFSVFGVETLRTLPAERQRTRFFEYWTLKESYIKTRGLGLSLPLDQFSFHIEDGRPIRISFAPDLRTIRGAGISLISARHRTT